MSMDPANRALWYIESHFADDISLDDIAAIGGVSRYHMVRAFGVATGHSVMRYLRARRLTEAAKLLANGAPSILDVALGAGYGSHEAFTWAFRDQFGLTPETVRAERLIAELDLMEPLRMTETILDTLEKPRFEAGKAMLVAGLSQRYTDQTCAGIPAQWQRFGPYIGNIAGQVGRIAYGVRYNSDDEGLDYMCGVEMTDFSDIPAEFSRLRIAPQHYAVFHHRDHISTIRRTWHTILSKWLPDNGHELADAPDFERYDEMRTVHLRRKRLADAPDFERYDEGFDPHTGQGGVEIWIPLKPKA